MKNEIIAIYVDSSNTMRAMIHCKSTFPGLENDLYCRILIRAMLKEFLFKFIKSL